MRGLENRHVVKDVRITAEDGGDLAQARLPCGAVDGERRCRGQDFCLGVLGGEVGGGVFLFGADLLLGLHLFERVESLAVAAVRGEPQAALDGGAVVGERQRDSGERAVAVRVMRVVERGRAEPYLDIGRARMRGVRGGDGAVLCGDGHVLCVIDGVAEVVGLLRGGLRVIGRRVTELRDGAVKFGVHDLEEDRIGW